MHAARAPAAIARLPHAGTTFGRLLRRPQGCRCHGTAAQEHPVLQGRQWLLADPAVEVATVREGAARFVVVRDDLLGHPFLGGNKFRKLDGLWAQLDPADDVVTCGGLQSAHTAAVAAACAQAGKRCHLLVRGERPVVPTGHHLFARMLAHRVEYVSRERYADRAAMLDSYLQRLQAVPGPPARVSVVPEGAAAPAALLGLVRLAAWLSGHPLLRGRRCNVVVDCGTGTTAAGLRLGVELLSLPWHVSGVMLAAEESYYEAHRRSLTAGFFAAYGLHGCSEYAASLGRQEAASRLAWVPRSAPRKFGRVLAGEVAACRGVAQRHGIVLDPIWTLAAWEHCCQLAAGGAGGGEQAGHGRGDDEPLVVMLHTGGSVLGLCGLAQRFPDQF